MSLVRRCLVAAASGLLATLALRAFPFSAVCTGPACMIVGLLVVPLVLFGAAMLAWALLALARVRPAWPVALGGPLVALALFTTVLDMAECPLPVFCAVVTGCYALAALVTADGLPRVWRVALGSPVVVLFAWGVVLPIVR
ncbi:hypothetical protein [Amycolatopsis australiensis]|uniref:Uncharacterized protein n=1 Tax=Amycolatopsis australiensis TaxID=546364 RepID=A0A1K1QUN5_9PSEU|nr:hypothetical protein [Amycolatopsis australiensis]SFW63623.1 hypothetical protein SAMN04489730_2274 [Amycolatopsis australiensis]